VSKAQIAAAKKALKRGDKESARNILEGLVGEDERNVDAWFLLAQVVESSEDKGICLENVVTIDPNHAAGLAARTALKEGRDPFSDDKDLFAAAEEELEAAFSDDTEEGFDVDDGAFDIGPDDAPEIVGRLDRFASNRRLLIWLMVFFGVGALCMFIIAIILLI